MIWQEDFLLDRTGRADGRVEGVEWFHLPEQALLEAKPAGKLFRDDLGAFSAVRRHLAFLPEDVRKKKLAGCFLLMGQAGLYNLPRCLARGDSGAARLALHEFVMQAAHAVFLLHSAYMPYYKWCFRAMRELALGEEYERRLTRLVTGEAAGRDEEITALCRDLCALAAGQGLDGYRGETMEGHADFINRGIEDERIRNLPLLYGV